MLNSQQKPTSSTNKFDHQNGNRNIIVPIALATSTAANIAVICATSAPITPLAQKRR